MAKDQELLIRINGTAKNFTDALDQAKKKTKDLEKSLTTVSKVSTAAFVGLAAAVAGTVVRFSSFEKGFTNVVTLLDKGSFKTKTLEKGIESLKDGIIALSARSGESLENLNQGLFDLVSSGVSAERSVATLEAATKLATAGATDTATAVKALTASLTSYGKEAGTADEIAQKFFTAQKFGVTTVGELATSFNKVGGLANNLGVSFNEALASLSSLTADGAKPTAEAATQLRAVLNSLILAQSKLGTQSAAVQDALSLQNIKQRGLVESLNLLKTATGGSEAQLQQLLGSSEALQAVFSLTGAQAGLVATQMSALGNAEESAATFAEALATKQATTEFALKQFTASADAAAVVFGELFAPTINQAAQALSAIAINLASLDKGTLQTIATVTAFVGAILGLVSALSIATLGYLKIRAGLIAFTTATQTGAVVQRGFQLTILLGSKALSAFRTGLVLATTTVRGFAAATGVGLIITALSLMITNLKETKAVTAGVFAFISAAGSNFAKTFSQTMLGVSDIVQGIFTFDKDKITAGFEQAKAAATAGASSLGTEAAEAYSAAYNSSIKASGAEEQLAQQQADAESKLALEQETAQAILDVEDEKNEALKAKSEEKSNADLEAIQEKFDREQALKEELALLSDEEQALLNEKELEQFQNTELTKRDIERQLASEKLKNNIKRRQQFIKDEVQFGKEIAKINLFFASEEVQLANQTAGRLVQLTQSKNQTLKSIGKAASLVQIGIKTAEGAISAYSSLAGIPIVGPALGAAAAGALIAFGTEQASAVLSARDGGIVPNGPGGSRDRIPAMLEPGEVVIPTALAPSFIQSVGRPESSIFGGEQSIAVTVGFRDEAFEIIESKLIERRRIDGIGLGALG